MNYHQPISKTMLDRLPVLVAQVTDQPTRVSLSSFPGNDGELLYGLNVSYNPRIVRVKDKRSNDFLVVDRHEFYLTEDGEVQDAVAFTYHRVSDYRGSDAFPVITEEEIREARAAEQRDEILKSMGIS